ncbi:Tyrosine-protein kinase Src42A [Halocaridina rubra]|uniref:Tyrosine-protein kinase n=1 Tax=Halocaridina rubra TaxID=373956 RepID=A0AAN9ABI0_HALRR
MALSWIIKKLRGQDDNALAIMRDPKTDNQGLRKRAVSVCENAGEISSFGNFRNSNRRISADASRLRDVRERGGIAALETKPTGVPPKGGKQFDSSAKQISESKSMLSGSPGTSSVVGLASGRMYVALFDYDARTGDDLSFRKSEHLEVLEMRSEEWWLAKSNITGLQGYIPAAYVAKLKSIQAEPWYFGDIGRPECERRLMSSDNSQGAFLVRDSETRKNEFSLSVRDGDQIRHYRIRPRDHGGFFISRRDPFSSLHELVDFYSTDSGGLCTKLGKPCVRQDKPDTVGLSYDTWDTWEIPKEQIQLGKKLGSGNFAEVFEGWWNKSVPVAVKMLRRGKMHADEFLAEAQLLKKMRHKNLLQLYAVCTKEEPFYIVTELMRHGSLLGYIRDRGRRIVFEDQIYIMAQVASGMEYLENMNYIHRDLAARNVLVGENYTVKVADFGLSRLVLEDSYQAHEGAKFPIKWTAPEALNFNKFTTKSDVWSFGILLMEIITYGKIPYPGMTNVEVVDRIENGYRMPQPSNCPLRLYNIMLETWAKDPNKRPTFNTLRWKLDDYFAMEDSDYREADDVP